MSDNRTYYLGNQKLKRANIPHYYTKDQVKEFLKCSKDIVYFIKKYIKIVDVDKGIVPFEMWPFQEEMVSTFVSNRFTICKLPRQMGKTVVTAATILWYVLFHENYSVALLAHKQLQSKEILSRIQLAYENLPNWLQQGVLTWNKGSVLLENGSKILASATSSSAIRGGSFSMIYLDEFAFVPSHLQSQFFASVYPTISAGQTTKIIITSTPKGLNMFYKLWVDAEQGKNSFVPIAVHWSQRPGRDDRWREETIKNTSEQQFREEFETEFIGSSNTLISANKLLSLASVEPIESNDHFASYENPQLPENKNQLYVLVVDTARGVGQDYSAFVVFNVTTTPYRVVARYYNNKIAPLVFPNIVHQYAKTYNNAYVCVEINDNGQQVADILYRELEYEHMVFSRVQGAKGQQVSSGFGTALNPGVRTTKQLKRIGCTNFKTLLEGDKLIIEDELIIKELYTFVEIGDSFEADGEDAHDDLAMCCVIFAWLTVQPYFKEWTDINIRERLVSDNRRLIEEDLLPFGFIDDAVSEMIDLDNPKMLSMNAFDRWLLEEN